MDSTIWLYVALGIVVLGIIIAGVGVFLMIKGIKHRNIERRKKK